MVATKIALLHACRASNSKFWHLRARQSLLRWHVCRVNFARKIFSSHEFSYEKCSEIFPENFEPLFCGSEKIPGKFPPNFPLNSPNFPAKNQKKKNSQTSFCRSAGRNLCLPLLVLGKAVSDCNPPHPTQRLPWLGLTISDTWDEKAYQQSRSCVQTPSLFCATTWALFRKF